MTKQELILNEVDKIIRRRCTFDSDGHCTSFSPDGLSREILTYLKEQGCLIKEREEGYTIYKELI